MRPQVTRLADSARCVKQGYINNYNVIPKVTIQTANRPEEKPNVIPEEGRATELTEWL